MTKIAVAISGGGYRATAWGLGTLWALRDAGLHDEVTCIASVSGGSIANAYVAQRAGFGQIPADEFAADAEALLGRLGGSKAGFGVPLKAALAATLVGLVATGLEAWPVVVGAAIALTVAVTIGALTSRDLVFGRWETWAYLAVLTASTWSVPFAWPHAGPVLLGLAAVAVIAHQRGRVVGWSLDRRLASLTQRADRSLGALNREPLPVILATELRAGHHASFAPSFVYSYDLGLGAAPRLPVRSAVMASANLPGAFPVRFLSTRSMALRGGAHAARTLALTDGGVYDNMADQWPIGWAKRIDRLERAIGPDPVLDDWRDRLADFTVVANASGALGFRPVRWSAIPLIGEVTGLLQVKDVLYDNGNSVRRSWLVDRFDAGDPAGTLVHIASDPAAFPAWAQHHGASEQVRARGGDASAYVVAHLGPEPARVALAARVAAVGTKLSPLGPATAREVARAAYVQTIANLHVKLGAPLVDPPM